MSEDFWYSESMHMSHATNSFTKIDMAKILRTRAPKGAPFVPRWVITKLERLLHLEQINDFMERHYHDQPLEFVRQCVEYLELKAEIENEEHLERLDAKRPIIVANHPLGGPESLVLMDALIPHGSDIRMVAKGIIGEIKPLKPILVPIPTSRDHDSISRFKKVFSGGATIVIFPAGYCSRPLSNGILFDYGWHSTFVKMARRFGRPLIPVHISGSNSKRFYRLSTWRRRLGIKASLESILLPDEMYRQQGNTIRLAIGRSIDPNVFDPQVPDTVWAERVRSHVFHLGNDRNTLFEPTAEPLLPII